MCRALPRAIPGEAFWCCCCCCWFLLLLLLLLLLLWLWLWLWLLLLLLSLLLLLLFSGWYASTRCCSQISQLNHACSHICCVFSLCGFSYLCVFSLCFLFVFPLCIFSLCFLAVFPLCVFSLCFLSVFSLCRKFPPHYQNDRFLSINVETRGVPCFLSGFAFYRTTKNDAFLSIDVDIILLWSGIAGQLLFTKSCC